MPVLLYWGWGLGSLGSGVAFAEVPLHSQSLQSAVKPGSGVAPGHGLGFSPGPAGGNGGRSGGVLPDSPQNAPACGPNWMAVPSPDQGPVQYTLNGVASVSANDVWAVGDLLGSTGEFQTLVEHWDGSAWSVVASPNQGTSSNYLYGVTAISASNVWAVGSYNGSVVQTLVEHWNGSAWSVVSSPNIGTVDPTT